MTAVLRISAMTAGILIAFFLARSITLPLNRVVKNLTSEAERVSSDSSQISTASQSLAEGSSDQAASIEETSSSLEEMAAINRQNSGNSAQADTLMKAAGRGGCQSQ